MTTPSTDGTRAYPFLEACERIGIGEVKAYEAINRGQLETFKIGRRRYCTEESLQRFIRERIAESSAETAQDRAATAAPAVAGRARERAKKAAEKA
jgi:hypothetical protein